MKPPERSSTAMTCRWRVSAIYAATCEPMKPAAPVTNTRVPAGGKLRGAETSWPGMGATQWKEWERGERVEMREGKWDVKKVVTAVGRCVEGGNAVKSEASMTTNNVKFGRETRGMANDE